ncbi:unnamed protein product [Ilex paraguariensis]|uniref:Palmitoyl-protein thioesterase 1 n=1 Tax=Ilex paraguariensis TaxID=185542 RepID=A0ABC8UVA2_9AQUA
MKGIFCIIADNLIKSEIYSDYVQAHLAPSGYLKLPNNLPAYLEKCRFLPKLNNEIPAERNSTYKERFSSLENLVLIMFEHDTVLIPKETAWFGYYPDGEFNPVMPPQQTQLYTEDWIGLKTLDDAGKVKFINVTGNHLGITRADMRKYVVPYLKDEESTESGTTEVVHPSSSESHQNMQVFRQGLDTASTEVMIEGSPSYSWPSSIKSVFGELLGFAGNE